jgi:glycogen operon protein
MLSCGDEIGRTQGGNNNAYCQDNDISWLDWSNVDADLLAFTRGLISIRHRHPAIRRKRFVSGVNASDIRWFTPAGSAMTDSDWTAGWTRSVVAYLDGSRDPDRDERGRPILDSDLLLCVNGWREPLAFTLPDIGAPRSWTIELDTFAGTAAAPAGSGPGAVAAVPAPDALVPGTEITVGPRSVVLLQSGNGAG